VTGRYYGIVWLKLVMTGRALGNAEIGMLLVRKSNIARPGRKLDKCFIIRDDQTISHHAAGK
jgi:hypothetical protein